FTYEPNEDFNGEDSFTYVANDGENVSEPALVVLNISPANDAPIFSDLDNINLDEDSNSDVLLSASDIDGDLLVFSIVNAESELGATMISNVLSITPENNYNGNGSIVLKVTDGEYEETQSVAVNVNPINDSPIIDAVEDISINEGEGAELELSAYDIDGDDLTFSVSSDDDVELSIDGTTLTLLSEPNAGDSEIVINVVVSDDEYTDTETFSVFTQNLNDAPSTESLSFEINEDSQFSIAPQGSDPDGDALSFSIVNSTENGSLELNNGLFIYNPNNDFVGTDSFTYLANDGEYDSQVSTVNMAINNVNDQPVLNSIDNQLLQEGESLELELSAEDIDGDALIYSAISDGDVVIDIIGNILTISPSDENFNGDVGIIVTVNDGQLEDSHNFSLTYSAINDIPQISSISDGEILEDAVFIYALSASDIDGDNIEFSAEVNGNAIATVQGNILTITPNQNYNGEINATVSASDGEYTVFSSFNIQVLAVNDAPIIPTIETQNAFEDTDFQFGIEVDDIDNDNHSFSVSMDTTFVNYSINGNLIVVEPMENWYGEILASISVSDDEFTATQSFIIEFSSVNDSPQIVSDAITEATEDLVYEYQMQIDDPDNDNFYFSLISGPAEMEISELGLITWLPTEGVMSSDLVGIVVWDTNNPAPGQDFPAYQEFTIDVESVNDAPVITSTPVISATEDEEYIYQVTASDIDSDYFSYSLAVAPAGMTISNNGLIEWIPTEGILSSDMVHVNVSDNDDVNPIISSQHFLVVVTPINDAPIIVSIADSSATTGEEYTYQVLVEDSDDDEFTYLLFNNPNEMDVDENGLVSWIPVLPGIYGPITLAVSDGGENDVQPVQELFIVVVEAASPLITMDFEFLHEASLISFLGIPEDSSVTSVFESLGDNAQGLIGEGVAANNLGNGNWVGSLYSIEPTSGYWVKLNNPPVESFVIEAYPTDPYINYDLSAGQNLISYVGSDGMGISEAIPDEYENSFYGIIGQGTATLQLTEGNWVGSLTQFNNLKGYWAQVDEDMDFNWNIPEDLVRESSPKVNSLKPVPSEFMYSQSTQQAFYFIEDANIDGFDLLVDDWLIAYHNNTVIGARLWNGQFTDIPAMGVDGFDDTFGYIEPGMIPEFKLFRESTGELIELTGEEIAPWINNEMTFVSLMRKEEIPNNVVLNPAYPNPFNPSTQLSFDIAVEGFVNLSVYDINGRLVEVLKNNEMSVGNHSIEWNAQSYASGIYFVQLVADNVSLSQKLILVK
ncbi:MAG: tandem-95 repeat protein, partial [Candidatus Marinimicrobia bacterium]|nr:tandem-95 repeat protein [Candidatus Neomarinimicrobiota bacterium]